MVQQARLLNAERVVQFLFARSPTTLARCFRRRQEEEDEEGEDFGFLRAGPFGPPGGAPLRLVPGPLPVPFPLPALPLSPLALPALLEAPPLPLPLPLPLPAPAPRLLLLPLSTGEAPPLLLLLPLSTGGVTAPAPGDGSDKRTGLQSRTTEQASCNRAVLTLPSLKRTQHRKASWCVAKSSCKEAAVAECMQAKTRHDSVTW